MQADEAVKPCDDIKDMEWRCSCGNVLHVPREMYRTKVGAARDAVLAAALPFAEKFHDADIPPEKWLDLEIAFLEAVTTYRRLTGGEPDDG